MLLQLRVVYDSDGNYSITDPDTDEVMTYGDLSGDEITTLNLEISLPEIKPPKAVIQIPHSDKPVIVSIE